MSGVDDDTLRADLNALLDGELPEERAAELRRRIEREPELRREYEALRRAVQAVRDLERASAPAELREHIQARVHRPAPVLRWLAPSLAAAAVLLVAVMIALRPDRPPVTAEARGAARPPRLDEKQAPGTGAEKLRAQPDAPGGESKDEGGFAGLTEAAEATKDRAADAVRPRREIGTRGGRQPARDAPVKKVGAPVKQPGPARDDGPDEADAAGKTALKKAKYREAGGSEPAKAKEEERKADPVGDVERGGALPTSEYVQGYLRALAARKPSAVVTHITSFGVSLASVKAHSAPRAKAAGAAVAAPTVTVQVAGEQEAKLVRDVMLRAFGADSRKKERARAGPVSSTQTGPEGGSVTTLIEATPDQFKRVRTWLERIGLARRAQPGASFPRAYPGAGVAGSKSVEQRYSIRLAYAKPKPKPEAEADDR